MITSLICEISNKAATLGIKFFPNVFAGAIICEKGSDNFTINGVKSLGLDNKIGVIKKGFLADIISLKVDSIYSTEEILYNNLENVLISTRIENVWVSGKKILNNAKLVTINEKILYDAYRIYNE